MSESQAQSLALAYRQASLKRFTFFPLRSEPAPGYGYTKPSTDDGYKQVMGTQGAVPRRARIQGSQTLRVTQL